MRMRIYSGGSDNGLIFKHCPRCNGAWRERHTIIRNQYCDDCHLAWHPDTQAIVWCFNHDGLDALCWWFNARPDRPDRQEAGCRLFLYGGSRYLRKDNEPVVLPLLPFTITKEDLQKYMVLV
jgi:hypothetical protein